MLSSGTVRQCGLDCMVQSAEVTVRALTLVQHWGPPLLQHSHYGRLVPQTLSSYTGGGRTTAPLESTVSWGRGTMEVVFILFSRISLLLRAFIRRAWAAITLNCFLRKCRRIIKPTNHHTSHQTRCRPASTPSLIAQLPPHHQRQFPLFPLPPSPSPPITHVPPLSPAASPYSSVAR
ncbi:hypothetical protein E2C01_023100 [Portunus trituberculatus]|uniref:Uncharacterized protein n=1 Tax=Portunus trituberculatus TaxID=210409 RepID=A0A5B7E746_PORTR|nr:hypothetical protein [Portunus trituberculatus]